MSANNSPVRLFKEFLGGAAGGAATWVFLVFAFGPMRCPPGVVPTLTSHMGCTNFFGGDPINITQGDADIIAVIVTFVLGAGIWTWDSWREARKAQQEEKQPQAPTDASQVTIRELRRRAGLPPDDPPSNL